MCDTVRSALWENNTSCQLDFLDASGNGLILLVSDAGVEFFRREGDTSTKVWKITAS